jgi:hypothetical protein
MVYIVFFILKYKANRNIKNMFEYEYWIYIYKFSGFVDITLQN